MVKDSKRGNTILVDQWLLYFVPHLHLTPQAMVDVENRWKNSRPVFDSLFRPKLWNEAFNDWVDKVTEGECHFPGAFKQFLTWVWNLRITYPELAIYFCDDDIKNAFCLIKHNPAVVSFNAFRALGLLGFCTGQTFGGNYTPQNFDPAAEARSQHAAWLWINEPERCMREAATILANVAYSEMEGIPFAKANADSLNKGVLDANGLRIAPNYQGHVDDHFWAEILPYLKLSIGASVVAVNDVFDGNHPYQEEVLSDEKLNLLYREVRLLLGYFPNSRTMRVDISPRRREKIILYIEAEGWVSSRKSATI